MHRTDSSFSIRVESGAAPQVVPAGCRSVLAIPVRADRRPDFKHRSRGMLCSVESGGIDLEFDLNAWHPARSLVLAVSEEDGACCHAGVEVRTTAPVAGRVRVHCGPGGPGHELLQPENLTPRFDLGAMELTRGWSEEVLDGWAEVGVLHSVVLGRLRVCPRCHGLPTYPRRCGRCGSARLSSERLLHHPACGHSGPVAEFVHSVGLCCPRCCARRLVLGQDCEQRSGPQRCLDCAWQDGDGELMAHCLRCEYHFPDRLAMERSVKGYQVQRLDVTGPLRAV